MLENDKLLYNSRVFTSQAALTDGLVFVKTLHQIFFIFGGKDGDLLERGIVHLSCSHAQPEDSLLESHVFRDAVVDRVKVVHCYTWTFEMWFNARKLKFTRPK